ncbi:hypothetical protein THRCLA_07972 [Thraustotheca clavata]|uniref:PX domain-containing protein n=1 Tax=Thraustotheca clavata TaxID=74557 RepID=A0A1V9ZBP5_9STRA|nr:hypothetical protein THRCLA_07972 [Thraustotheca clavata]
MIRHGRWHVKLDEKKELPAKPIKTMKGVLIHRVIAHSRTDFIEYELVIEESRTGKIWDINRRYSVFAELREDIDELFDAPHCHYCKNMLFKLRQLAFPEKKIFHTEQVIQTRTVVLQAYIEALLKLMTNSFHRNCTLVACQAHGLLSRFLTQGRIRHVNITSKDMPQAMIPCLLRQMQVSQRTKRPGGLEPIKELALAC